MRIFKVWFLIITLLLSPMFNLEGHAQSMKEEIQELKRMIEQNQKENDELKQRIQQLESQKATDDKRVEELYVKQQEHDAELDGLIKLWKSLKLGFYLDTTYQAAFHQPNDQDILLRSLYPDQNQFNINAFTISLAKDPEFSDSVWDLIGFRADVLLGQQAPLLASAGLESDVIDPYQMYIHVIAPVGNGVDVYAGKFVTLAGYEVIEARNDPNISRSILFGFAIPFTHTGIRAHYGAGPFDFYLGMNNGWDTVKNDDGNFTLESQVAVGAEDIAPWLSAASIALTGYFGKESEDDPGVIQFDDWRNLISIVGSVTLFDRLTLVANPDFGWQQGITSADLDLNDQQAFWWGIAGYAIVDLYKEVAHFALRGEFFKDRNRFRTFADDSSATKFFELTPTLSVRPFKGLAIGGKYLDNLELRGEFRWDWANEPYFLRKNGDLNKNQYELSAQLLYWFDTGEFEPEKTIESHPE
jgi:regulator of replication initiation timing